MWLSLAVLLAFQTPADPDAGPGVLEDTYLDATARELITGARAYRDRVDRSIVAYEVVARERVSLGLNTPGRERLVFRAESVARVHWHRSDAIRIEMLGGRWAVPIVSRRVQAPGRNDSPVHLAFDPVDDGLIAGLGGRDFLRHPLDHDAGDHYRYRSGDSTRIQLPDGHVIRLREVVLIPRRSDPRLIGGSLWIDVDSHAVVQALVRPIRPFDLRAEGRARRDGDDRRTVSAGGTIEGEIHQIWIEYGWWDRRWWLPAMVVFEGSGRVGELLAVPLQLERRYDGYVVEADPAWSERLAAGAEPDTASPAEGCDPADRACYCRRGSCRVFEVERPGAEELVRSEWFEGSIYSGEAALVSRDELDAMAERLSSLAAPPWQFARPGFAWSVGRGGLLRYNRVEGASVGARAILDVGRLTGDATVRYGTARTASAELGIATVGPGRFWRLAAYDRVAAANPGVRPLALGNSIMAFFFGRDDGEYFRARGVELTGQPESGNPGGLNWRLYGERHGVVEKRTDFSLRHWRDDGFVFRENLRAEPATQFGVDASVRYQRGVDPASLRLGAELSLSASTGTFDYLQPSVALRANAPVGARVAAAVEVAAGATAGSAPPQAWWFLGGPATLRGFAGGAARGEAFWRSRIELGTAAPGARLAVFSDLGWAGPGAEFTDPADRPLASAGGGLSFLDGLIRFDLARPIQRSGGWRADLYFDAAF